MKIIGQVLLTKKEAILAEMLLSKFPRTASREDLLAALWDDESFVEENTLNVNITRLRKKNLFRSKMNFWTFWE
ncbi:winged helix-turn-helix domain-containing protein [Bacillus sp. B-TM1]